MAEPTALRLHDNQPFQDQLGHAVHLLVAPTITHLTIHANLNGSFPLKRAFKVRSAYVPRHCDALAALDQKHLPIASSGRKD
jgi:hypothetical protein